MMLSDVRLFICLCVTSDCLSVAYIGPKSRTERPSKTKIGKEVGHVTCNSATTFKVKRSKVKVRGGHIVAASRLQLLQNDIETARLEMGKNPEFLVRVRWSSLSIELESSFRGGHLLRINCNCKYQLIGRRQRSLLC